MEISFTKAVPAAPVAEHYDAVLLEKTAFEIMLPRIAFLILKIMGVVLALGLLMSSPAFLAPVLLLGIALLTYRTMKKENSSN